jgi:hypothetical protein
MSFTLSSRWGRAAAGVTLALTLSSSAPAHAAEDEPPPPGTERVIRIGPQATVIEDEHGNLSLADDAAPEQSVGDVVRGALSVMGLGALLFLNGAGELIFDRSNSTRR